MLSCHQSFGMGCFHATELWNAKNFHRFAIELWRLESKKTIGPT
jgi:hypothetical protein